ncbi:MAG TPA: DUF433 domain-containing protein [Methylomirabilota bacterium]|nr:DUF433 domain-containing protein [Methylomirabilota bacterium]
MSTIASIEHILLDDHGVAWIKGSRTKITEIVLDQQAYGWSPEEIHFQHPDLTLAQIHAALAYYYDHRVQLDQEIERRLMEVGELRDRLPEPPLIARLREQKKRPA